MTTELDRATPRHVARHPSCIHFAYHTHGSMGRGKAKSGGMRSLHHLPAPTPSATTHHGAASISKRGLKKEHRLNRYNTRRSCGLLRFVTSQAQKGITLTLACWADWSASCTAPIRTAHAAHKQPASASCHSDRPRYAARLQTKLANTLYRRTSHVLPGACHPPPPPSRPRRKAGSS